MSRALVIDRIEHVSDRVVPCIWCSMDAQLHTLSFLASNGVANARSFNEADHRTVVTRFEPW